MTPAGGAPAVVVVGAGMAGLSTAYELHTRGIPCLVVDRAARAGGVIISEKVGEFTIDGGPDSLLAQKPDGVRLCEEIGLGSRLISTKPPRLAYIQRDGALHPLPQSSVLGVPTQVGPFLRTRLFSTAGKLRMALEIGLPPRRTAASGDGADDDESIGSFMTRRFGREATTYLAEPLLAGIHAGDVDRLSVRALFPRFVEAEREYGSLLRAFRRQRSHETRDDQGAFRSLPGGLSELVEALVTRLPPRTVQLTSPVLRLQRDGGDFVAEGEGMGPLRARVLVLATPAYVTAKLLEPLDPKIGELCGSVPYASTATVAMAFPQTAVSRPLLGSGFVVPRVERTGILAGSWLSSKWAHRAPEGHVLLRAFLGGARDPLALERTDEALIAIALSALRPLLGITGEPTLTRVYRFERASAQHEVGHLARMAEIDRRLAAHAGLYVTGSGFRGVGIPDCVADGRRTGKQVAEWLSQSAS